MINVLILNWNSAAEVATLVQSLSMSVGAKYRIILIHNATNDEQELRAIPDKYSDIEFHVVINETNLGYAGGNNAGYEYLRQQSLDGDLVVINPDVSVAPNTLHELQKASLRDHVGLVMCRTYDTNGQHLYDYIRLDGFINKYHFSESLTIDTDYAAGSCLYIKRAAADQCGLFDADFFMYWEEVDLAFRYRDYGYKSISTTKTKIIRAPNPISRSENAIYFSVLNSKRIKDRYIKIGYFKYLFVNFLSALYASVRYHSFKYLKSFIKAFKYEN
ncbi:glycosyltransferase family 2 protein [Pseudoalteromonas sp. T1lg75]|uniref:glycosyltransferase family 2 protein n=1 Tax=Pseudoalteromonas sp. T1lg75 TaxID=2077102 RepID=UPI000CF6CE13|nr:glycosyltransferase [Pseudoalteromonas sp. T1lg75]